MKIPKLAYATEFMELAVKRLKDDQSISAVIKKLGLSDQTLRNWIKTSADDRLKGAGGKVATPKEMELSRLRAENLASSGRTVTIRRPPSFHRNAAG